jgi:hypothetical protein
MIRRDAFICFELDSPDAIVWQEGRITIYTKRKGQDHTFIIKILYQLPPVLS